MTKDELQLRGLKVTMPRLAILSLFETHSKHLSAEQIYQHLKEQGQDIGLATVYRALTQFENANLLIRHNFAGGQASFELNEGSHHDHMVCVKCNTVEEFFDDVIEKRQLEVARESSFKMVDHSHNIYGLCKSCQE